MKEIFSAVAVIIGAIIGAGFASGKEIITFFNIYGKSGLIGIIISSLIFGIVITVCLSTINKFKIKEYEELVGKNKFILQILKLFSLICFCIMISGVGAFFKEQLNLNFWYGVLFAAAFSYAMFLNDFKGLEAFSKVLVPIIIIGIMILGLSNYDGMEISASMTSQNLHKRSFLLSGVLYASYNSLILVPILINFREYNFNKKKVLIIGLISSIILCVLMLLIYKVSDMFYPEILKYDLPNMHLASMLSKGFETLYGVIIISAIFTTAFSCGFSFLKMRRQKNYEKNALRICLLSVLCARFGFANLIDFCFPIFGYLGIFQILLIIFRNKGVKNEKK